LAYALDVAARVPADHPFFLPIRLDACKIPATIAKRVHYLDLFPDWQTGVSSLVLALNVHEQNRK
jgi:hypothetical protein